MKNEAIKILKAIRPIYQELYENYDPEGEIAVHIEFDMEAEKVTSEEYRMVKALSKHFGLKEDEIQHDNEDYDNEFIIMNNKIEVVTVKQAIDNELDNVSCEELIWYMDADEIGMYTYLKGNEYLFRWLYINK